ncbi:7179_t:CDS:1 [Ambispora gerdemannii]|uniref:7179_t:CDS:1 n=1 Tax=Ambispora gerdemannii TaxID=144530 RepID=A0A9N9BNR8_9GLOM|nr:7179_t:CDS:1 [Ambispora gerdemannii]
MFSNNSDFFVLIMFMLVQSLVLYLNTRRVKNCITAELSAIKRSRRNSGANTELLQRINELDRNISLMGYEVRDPKFFSTMWRATKWHLTENETFYIIYVGGIVIDNQSLFRDRKINYLAIVYQ